MNRSKSQIDQTRDLAFNLGQILGMLSRDNIKEWLIESGQPESRIELIKQEISKLAEVFYKNK